ncbi:MAG TPA: hypothetical protein P5337_09195 [Aestuariivirga sp.]|nr:hypothetical protein [Alphaproteobacteria bacterium]HRX36562.1 hypothetical protein [Aestuariivirga sp.]
MFKHLDLVMMAAADSSRGHCPPHTDEEEDKVSKPLVHYNKENRKTEKRREGEPVPSSKERDSAARRDTAKD